MQSLIDMSNIPKRFGGDFDYEQGMAIDLDAPTREVLSWLPPHKELPLGPLKWTEDGKGGVSIVTVGKSDGKLRNERIATLRSHGRKRKGKGHRGTSQDARSSRSSLDWSILRFG